MTMLLALILAAAVADHHAGIYTDMSRLPKPQYGVEKQMLSPKGPLPVNHCKPGEKCRDEGAVRVLCNWSKVGYLDPIVYPGQASTAHNHTFFGNTTVTKDTTSENLRTRGRATCRGGTINKSLYWVPSMTEGGYVLEPLHLIVYYKTGAFPYMKAGSSISALPVGLKMVVGDATSAEPQFYTDSAGDKQPVSTFECFMPNGTTRPWTGSKGEISATPCEVGDWFRARIGFRQCWDGRLDSPDHRSHMADVVRQPGNEPGYDPYSPLQCPATHPTLLPAITYLVDYLVKPGQDTSKWRAASDVYDKSLPGGRSYHADWMNGWNPIISNLWAKECIQKQTDCGSFNLGDGRVTVEFQGN